MATTATAPSFDDASAAAAGQSMEDLKAALQNPNLSSEERERFKKKLKKKRNKENKKQGDKTPSEPRTATSPAEVKEQDSTAATAKPAAAAAETNAVLQDPEGQSLIEELKAALQNSKLSSEDREKIKKKLKKKRHKENKRARSPVKSRDNQDATTSGEKKEQPEEEQATETCKTTTPVEEHTMSSQKEPGVNAVTSENKEQPEEGQKAETFKPAEEHNDATSSEEKKEQPEGDQVQETSRTVKPAEELNTNPQKEPLDDATSAEEKKEQPEEDRVDETSKKTMPVEEYNTSTQKEPEAVLEEESNVQADTGATEVKQMPEAEDPIAGDQDTDSKNKPDDKPPSVESSQQPGEDPAEERPSEETNGYKASCNGHDSTKTETKPSEKINTMPRQKIHAAILGLLLCTVIAVLVSTQGKWAVSLVDQLCSPLPPNQVLDANVTADGSDVSGVAPWWVPEPYKPKAFQHICGPDRVQTMLFWARMKGSLRTAAPHHILTIHDLSSGDKKPLVMKKRVFDAILSPTSLEVTVKPGKTEIIQAPWTTST